MLKALAIGACSYIDIVILVKTKNSLHLSILALYHSFLRGWKEQNASSRLTYIDFLESKQQNMKMNSPGSTYLKNTFCGFIFWGEGWAS